MEEKHKCTSHQRYVKCHLWPPSSHLPCVEWKSYMAWRRIDLLSLSVGWDSDSSLSLKLLLCGWCCAVERNVHYWQDIIIANVILYVSQLGTWNNWKKVWIYVWKAKPIVQRKYSKRKKKKRKLTRRNTLLYYWPHDGAVWQASHRCACWILLADVVWGWEREREREPPGVGPSEPWRSLAAQHPGISPVFDPGSGKKTRNGGLQQIHPFTTQMFLVVQRTN